MTDNSFTTYTNGHKAVLVSTPFQMHDEPPPGFVLDEKGQFVVLPEDGTPYDWRADALCHSKYSTFDLLSLTGEDNPAIHDEDEQVRRANIRKANARRVREARKLCFECPVFQQCWDDAWKGKTLPLGVIRAGAKLSNTSDYERQSAMMRAMVLFHEYQEDKEWTHGR